MQRPVAPRIIRASHRESGGLPVIPPPTDMPNGSDAEATMYRLMSWLMPGYATGDCRYSHGLEWSVATGEVATAECVREWLAGVLRFGSGRADAVLLSHAARATSASAVAEVAELAVALCPSSERRAETTAQGRAFLEATRASWPCRRLELLELVDEDALSYPVVVGVTTAGHGIPNHSARLAFLHAFAANLVSAAVRLTELDQTAGQGIVSALEPTIRDVAHSAGELPLEGLGGCALLADIASMRHETQAGCRFST
jgi:urease accessory protein